MNNLIREFEHTNLEDLEETLKKEFKEIGFGV